MERIGSSFFIDLEWNELERLNAGANPAKRGSAKLDNPERFAASMVS
jgi:hypothetical protein